MTGGEMGSANRLNKKRGARRCLSQPRMLALSVQWGCLHSTLQALPALRVQTSDLHSYRAKNELDWEGKVQTQSRNLVERLQ